ncbi:adenosylcobinamide-phosphate synthase CbiB [Prosthecomicrobium pneumaticum]|uniref:Cobalamin biosynthesis protein CobD n=1 Tax=Prosthecomicrobium pneumaticum TaxID=81895 RepID=A0A7W9L3H8_9HYPH|nr:adenosylcobinamide-phosphate synthase [Prosthecomicrobium pneumaticum]
MIADWLDLHFAALALALLVDAAIGDPDWLWRRLPHPVTWFGALIGLLDRTLNREDMATPTRRALGVVAVVLLVAVAIAAGVALDWLFDNSWWGFFATVLVVAVMLAGRSLYDHVRAVADAFDRGGLPAARTAVARIVGRDPDSLDEAGVCRAAVESAAENFSDGLVAPAFWFAAAGLPGLLAYKAINTADSMIGHRTPRHEAFGWAAARLDDLVNLPASRIAAGLIVLAAPVVGGRIPDAFAAMLDDARKHRSPNAGWPEAAAAGALRLALAGPRRYHGVVVDDPFLNPAGRRGVRPRDIREALKLMIAAAALGWLVLATFALS